MVRTIVLERDGEWIGPLLPIHRPTPRTNEHGVTRSRRRRWSHGNVRPGFARLDSPRRPFRRIVLAPVADLDFISRLGIVTPIGALGLLCLHVPLLGPLLDALLVPGSRADKAAERHEERYCPLPSTSRAVLAANDVNRVISARLHEVHFPPQAHGRAAASKERDAGDGYGNRSDSYVGHTASPFRRVQGKVSSRPSAIEGPSRATLEPQAASRVPEPYDGISTTCKRSWTAAAVPGCQGDESVREMKRGPGIAPALSCCRATTARLAHRFSTAGASTYLRRARRDIRSGR